MKLPNSAALNTGPDFHLLDHIAPLADLLQIPLITTEEKNFELAKLYYPKVETHLVPDLEHRLGDLAERFDVLFECKYWQPHLKALFKQLYRKEMRLVFCPHGQSDKGFKTPLLAPYVQQDAVLIYGDLLIEMLKKLGAWPLSRYALVGNYRLHFYRKYQPFYDRLAETQIFSRLKKNQRTLLYAPTWRDADRSTSFFDYGTAVLSELPADWNLIVKIHPLLEQRDPAQFYRIAASIDKTPNALLVSDFPPVYPILSRSDAYLGDFSSVGYDFLHFKRPLFFLPSSLPSKIRSCGYAADPGNLYASLDKPHPLPLQKKQAELYRFAFPEIEPEKIRKNILQIL